MSSPPANSPLYAIAEMFRMREHFLLTSHARPDGDAIGSLLACQLLLRRLGRQTRAVLAQPAPHIYHRLAGASEILCSTRAPRPLPGEVAVFLECPGFARTHIHDWEGYTTVNIDHHASAHEFADLNWIDPVSPALAVMIYQLSLALEIIPDTEMATCLYTGLLADTGSFVFPNTTAATLEMGAALIHCGANPHRIAESMYLSYSEAKMRLLASALQHLHVKRPMAWMFVSEDEAKRLGMKEEDAEGLVNYALGIEGVEVAAFFRPVGLGGQRISLRSKGLINVAKVAESFGGGGHYHASGFSQPGSLAGVMEEVLAELRRTLQMQTKATTMAVG